MTSYIYVFRDPRPKYDYNDIGLWLDDFSRVGVKVGFKALGGVGQIREMLHKVFNGCNSYETTFDERLTPYTRAEIRFKDAKQAEKLEESLSRLC